MTSSKTRSRDYYFEMSIYEISYVYRTTLTQSFLLGLNWFRIYEGDPFALLGYLMSKKPSLARVKGREEC